VFHVHCLHPVAPFRRCYNARYITPIVNRLLGKTHTSNSECRRTALDQHRSPRQIPSPTMLG
jgi:hypothetical protein